MSGRVILHRGDLLDKEEIRSIVSETRPDRVFHLAALSSVPASWEDPARTFETNINTGIHLLEACMAAKNEMRVLLLSSADIYGGGDLSGQITEESPYAPNNPYAVSKLALDLASAKIAEANGLHLVRVRPMNHTGPHQATGFVIPDLSKQIAEIEIKKKDPILRTGNLEPRRDFSDVRDIVRAYAVAAERGHPGEAYLVCSGQTNSIREALEVLLSYAKISIMVEADLRKNRPSESNVGSASHSKFTQTTGWHPEIPFEQTLRETLDYWREKIGR
ncbi:MAG: GDP-mannose 4,6-dehydratase [Nitrospinota bacterium]|nr:GDP-mannose 4,6-dehydratase [Nitrospinota bacterium]